MTPGQTPALIVTVSDDPLDEDAKVLQCPHCDNIGISVREVDKATRWNIAEPEIEGNALILAYSGDDGDYHHDHYECDTCDGVVTLPANLNAKESWS